MEAYNGKNIYLHSEPNPVHTTTTIGWVRWLCKYIQVMNKELKYNIEFISLLTIDISGHILGDDQRTSSDIPLPNWIHINMWTLPKEGIVVD